MNELNSTSVTDKASAAQIDPVGKRKSRWLMKLFLSLVILLCGIVIGVVVTLSFIRHTFNSFQFQPEVATQRVMARFNSKYDLTQQQQNNLEKIVRDHFETLEKIGQEVHPRIHTQMDEFGEKIAEELNDEQRADWKKRFKYLRENFLPREPFRQPRE